MDSEELDSFGLPIDEAPSKELASYNADLLNQIKKGLETIPGARVLKSNYNARGVDAVLLFKEPNGNVRRYHLTLEKEYGTGAPELP